MPPCSLVVIESTCMYCTDVVDFDILFDPFMFQIVDRLPNLLTCLQCGFTAVRHMAARCVGMLTRVMTSRLMMFCVEKVIPFLGASDKERQRQGATEALSRILIQFDC